MTLTQGYLLLCFKSAPPPSPHHSLTSVHFSHYTLLDHSCGYWSWGVEDRDRVSMLHHMVLSIKVAKQILLNHIYPSVATGDVFHNIAQLTY